MLPTPPKLKLTPRQRRFLAGEIYPPDEPYEQPPLGEETRQRNLKGVADARAALHAKKPYKEGTQGQFPSSHRKEQIIRRHKKARDDRIILAQEESQRVRSVEEGDFPIVTNFDEVEQALLAASNVGTVPATSNPTPFSQGRPGTRPGLSPILHPVEGLEEFNEQNPMWEEGVAGQWFYDVGPSPVDYFKAGTHGQIYGDYGTSGFAQPAVSTPKKAGPPPPGATSSRPVEDKPPTLSNRSYFSSGTQGQPMPRDRSKEARQREVEQRKERRRKYGDGRPRTDKTTPFDTMTREELMRYRDEEAQRVRDEK
jgi:hypothetical protein